MQIPEYTRIGAYIIADQFEYEDGSFRPTVFVSSLNEARNIVKCLDLEVTPLRHTVGMQESPIFSVDLGELNGEPMTMIEEHMIQDFPSKAVLASVDADSARVILAAMQGLSRGLQSGTPHLQ